MNEIYLDNAATTPIKKEVLDEMLPFLNLYYGNPSSAHNLGQEAFRGISNARYKVASILNCNQDEIFFTSGGSESDNWAIKGCVKQLKKLGKKHIISSVIEHHAVLHTLDVLEQEGFEITRLRVDKNGFVNAEELEKAIRSDTALITIMYANNEIGTIQDIARFVDIAHKHSVLFHTDAVQAVGAVEIDLNELGVDMLSLSAHKFNGPKGVGALFIRKGINISPIINGGIQEEGRRAGTENVAGIVGLGRALGLAYTNFQYKVWGIESMRDYVLSRCMQLPR